MSDKSTGQFTVYVCKRGDQTTYAQNTTRIATLPDRESATIMAATLLEDTTYEVVWIVDEQRKALIENCTLSYFFPR